MNVPANTLSKPDPSNELPVKPHAFQLWKTPPTLTVTDPPVMLHVVVPLGMLSVLLADTDTLPAVIDRPPVVPLPSVVVAALPATASASVPPLIDTRLVNVLAACTVTCPLLIVTAGLNAGWATARRSSPLDTVTVAEPNAPNTLFATNVPPDTVSEPAVADTVAALANVVVPAANFSVPPPIDIAPAQFALLPPPSCSTPAPTLRLVPVTRFSGAFTVADAAAVVVIELVPAVTNTPPVFTPSTPVLLIVNAELPWCVHVPLANATLPAVQATVLLVVT